jgi:hypothetical protein
MLGQDGKMVDVTGMSRKEIAQLKYKPSTLSTTLKMLFSYFKDNEVMF